MNLKELFKRYKTYTIVGLIVLIMLVAGGTTLGIILSKQGNQNLNLLAYTVIFTSGDLEYKTTSTNTVEVNGTTSTSISGAVEIPSTVTNDGTTYTVTSIGTQAFYGCDGLTSITIPSSVTSIGFSAFNRCSGLTSITIPDSVTSIGRYAFYGCDGLTSITIPSSVTSIDDDAFNGCSGLTSVYYSGDVNDWVSTDFGNEYANPLYYADNFYLEGQTSTPYVFPSHLDLSDAIKIGPYSLYNQTGITSVTIGNQVTSIGSSAFYNCSGLTGSITIPSSVTSIGESAFFNCSRLTSITIPDSVTSIGGYAFNRCSGLTSIYYSGDINDWVSIDFGNGSANPLDYADNFYLEGGTSTPITSVNIDTATIISDYAFYSYTNLTSVTIGNQVISIGAFAFSRCRGLTSITIGEGVTSIGRSAFFGCSSLTSIDVDSDNTAYSSIDGVLFNKTQTELIQYPASKSGTSYSIPSSITSIGSSAFEDCSGLTSITMPDSVTSIGSSAFSGCSSLINVYFYNDISSDTSSIGSSAFRYGSSTVTYWVKDQTSLTNIQTIYNASTTKFTANNFQIMTVQVAVADNSIGLGSVSGGGIVGNNTLVAAPNNNSNGFLGWSTTSDGSNIIEGTAGQTTYTATVEGTYYAVFEKRLPGFTIIADTGTVTSNNYINLDSLMASVTLMPESGYYINEFSFDNGTFYKIEYRSAILDADFDFALSVQYTASNNSNYVTLTLNTILMSYFDSNDTINIYLHLTTTPYTNLTVGGSVSGVAVSVALQDENSTTLAAVGEARITGYSTLEGIDSVHVSALAYKGYEFVGWQVDGEFLTTDGSTLYTATSDIPLSLVKNKQLTAIFTPQDNSHVDSTTDNQ